MTIQKHFIVKYKFISLTFIVQYCWAINFMDSKKYCQKEYFYVIDLEDGSGFEFSLQGISFCSHAYILPSRCFSWGWFPWRRYINCTRLSGWCFRFISGIQCFEHHFNFVLTVSENNNRWWNDVLMFCHSVYRLAYNIFMR